METKQDRLLRCLDAAQPAVELAAKTSHYWIWAVVTLYLLSGGFGMGTGGPFRYLAVILVLTAAVITHVMRPWVASGQSMVSQGRVPMVRSRATHFQRSAMIDETSGALRARTFEEALGVEHERVRRLTSGPDSSLVLVDLGPAGGGPAALQDAEGLRAITEAIRSAVRFEDAVGLVDTQQFGIVLYGITPDDAWRVARRVQSVLAEAGRAGGPPAPIAARVGVASLRSATSPESARARARTALVGPVDPALDRPTG